MPAPRPPSRQAPARRPHGRRASGAAGWAADQLDQPAEKIARRLVLDQMMGQDAGRLAAVDAAAAARPQMPDEPGKRRRFADKAAAAAPGDQIDMDIGLEHARARPRRAPRLDPRDRTRCRSGRAAAEDCRQSGSTAAPGRQARGPRTMPRAASAPRQDRPRFPSGSRDGGNSLFLPPAAWSRWRQPCCSTATQTPVPLGRAGPRARGRPAPGSPRAPPAPRRLSPAGCRGAARAPPHRRHATTASRSSLARPTGSSSSARSDHCADRGREAADSCYHLPVR